MWDYFNTRRLNNKNLINIHIILFQEYQKIVDAEWKILYEKLENIHKSGAKVVLSKLPIGDVATQYFADRYTIFEFLPEFS